MSLIIDLCNNNYTLILKDLLDRGVDINAKDKHGNTALTYACIHDKPEWIRLLLENKAMINRENKNEDNILSYMYHYYKNNIDLISILIKNNAKLDILF